MLKRNARLRREYIYRKRNQFNLKNHTNAIDDPNLGGSLQSEIDDEYKFGGVQDPKIVITSSRDPSSRLKMFVKELRYLFLQEIVKLLSNEPENIE